MFHPQDPRAQGFAEYSTSADVILVVQGADGKQYKVSLGNSAELNYVNGLTAGTVTASKALVVDANKEIDQIVNVPIVKRVSFTEDGSGTSYTGTVPIPAGSHLLDIYFWSTVLWDGTSASLIVGDDDDANGFFTATNLKATDLLVGQMLQMSNSSYWGGVEGAYLVAATGTRTPVYYATANNVIAVITPGAADGSAGRSFMDVTYVTPVAVASTNV